MRTHKLPSNFILRVLLIGAAVMTSALSVEAQERASAPEPGKAVTAPLLIPVAPVANRAGQQSVETPDAMVKPSTTPATDVEKPVPHVALILPLASKTLGRVAEALKLGFIAGAEADGQNAPVYRVYTTVDEGASLAALYRQAISDGAIAIIGGLTRDGANVIARESRFLPTLALNAPVVSSDNDLPDRFFYISLSLDVEARLIARMASDEGLRSVAVVVANSPLEKRIQESFEKETLRLGGEIVARISFGGNRSEAARVTTAMEKLGSRASVVFLAADPGAARFIRPYLPVGMPVFTTSHSVDPNAAAVANLDLDNVRFLDMPWFAERDHPAVMAYAKPAQAFSVELERLYVLGIDAWRLGQLIVKPENAKSLPPLDGVTGRITQDGHQLTRALSSVEIHDGKSQLYRRGE